MSGVSIAVAEEQVELAKSVRGWAERAKVRESARQVADVPAEDHPARPEWWSGLVELGLTGIALPEDHGGSGASAVELAVVVEELGRAGAAGPFVPAAIAGLALLFATGGVRDD